VDVGFFFTIDCWTYYGGWGRGLGLHREAGIRRDGIRGVAVMDKGYVCTAFWDVWKGLCNLWKPETLMKEWGFGDVVGGLVT
jgi:hypothetical protein